MDTHYPVPRNVKAPSEVRKGARKTDENYNKIIVFLYVHAPTHSLTNASQARVTVGLTAE